MERKQACPGSSHEHSVISNLVSSVSETHSWLVNHAAKRDPVSYLALTPGDMVISHLPLLCILASLLCRQRARERKKNPDRQLQSVTASFIQNIMEL